MTDIFEGSIIRAIRRLDEFVNQVRPNLCFFVFIFVTKTKVFSLHAMFDGTLRLTWQVLKTLSSSLSFSCPRIAEPEC
jgi:hypothetical protein